MSHQALYRKYRSQTFNDLVGQDHVVRTLQNSIAKGKIGQAYLFTGPRGTGKTSTARLLAKALNCTGGPSTEIPDDCPICAEITVGACMDVVEVDAASESGVDQVREHIVQASEYTPSYCRYKVFIIDEVHDLSGKAFDALLKTIEEPPAHVVFILATTEFNKVPPTIRSRCQRFEFHRGTIQELVARLDYVAKAEGVEAEPAALAAIARMADGGYRDALTLFEQAMMTGDGVLTLTHVYEQLGLVGDEQADRLIEAIATQDISGILGTTEEIYRTGRDPASIIESLLHRLSDLTRAAYQVKEGASLDAAAEAGLTATAGRIGAETIVSIRSHVSVAHRGIRDVSLPRIWLEAELVRVSQLLVAPVLRAAGMAVGAGVERQAVSTAKAVTAGASVPASSVSASEREVSEPERVSVGQPSLEAKKAAVLKSIDLDKVEGGPWEKVVAVMSATSKTVALRLPKSSFFSDEGGTVTIEFERESDADWLTDKLPVQKAIIQEWLRITGEERNFRFVGPQSGPRPTAAPKVEKASVESPLEGEPLAQEIKSVFGVRDGGQDNDETS